MKLLALGIDGADPEIFKKMDMPFMHGLMGQNTEIPLEEDLLSRGWAEFYTGRHASETGAFYDYPLLGKSYDKSQKFGLGMLPDGIVPIWSRLSEKGCKVGIMNVPTTMPAQNVNGFMVAGGGGGLNRLRQIQPELYYPGSVGKLLQERSYVVDLRLTTSGITEIDDFFKKFKEMTRIRTDVFIALCKKHVPDFSFLAYRGMAIVQYLGMSELEYLFQGAYTPDGDPQDPCSLFFRDQMVHFYAFFDQCMKEIFEHLQPKNFIVFSDHGKVPYIYNLNYNEFIKETGLQTQNRKMTHPSYVKIKKLVPPAIKNLVRSLASRKAGTLYLPFNMETTKAFTLHLVNGIYINDDERFGGPVSGAAEIKDLVRVICREFNGHEEARKHRMSAVPYRERFPGTKFAGHLPDIWIDKPDIMRPYGPGNRFVEKNPHYRHITRLTDVYDDNWTGVKSRHPLFVVNREAADRIDPARRDLTAGYALIDGLFQQGY